MDHRAIILAALIASLGTVGCVSADQQGQAKDSTDLEPPAWEIGQEWHYQEVNGSQWRNWTVVGMEEKHGYDTYRVRVQLSPPDQFGREIYINWFDQETLGLVAGMQGENNDTYAWANPPALQFFPVENRTYSYTFHTSEFDRNLELNESLDVGGEQKIHTPVGSRLGVELTHTELDRNITKRHGWYNSEVGYYVKFSDRDQTFVLTTWSKARA